MRPSLLTLSSFSLIIAASQAYSFNINQGNFLLELGVYNGTQGQSQDVAIQDLIGDRFNVTDRHDTNAIVGLGYMLKGMEHKQFIIDYGINAFYLAPTQASGTINQEHLFTNLAYSYSVSHVPVYAAAKATINTNAKSLALTFDAGIGPNFIRTSNYQDWSLDAITLPDHAFLGHSSTTFSAMAGVGLKFTSLINPVECGYRFFYLGDGHLDPRTNQITTNLKTGSNYAQALLCTLTV